jgi:hypothetical protein
MSIHINIRYFKISQYHAGLSTNKISNPCHILAILSKIILYCNSSSIYMKPTLKIYLKVQIDRR